VAKLNLQEQIDQATNDVRIKDLQEDMQQYPGQALHWMLQAADAAKQLKQAEMNLSTAEASAAQALRNSGRKVTENSIKEQVALDGRCESFRSELIEARHAMNVFKAITDSMESKPNLMINLAKDKLEQTRVPQVTGHEGQQQVKRFKDYKTKRPK